MGFIKKLILALSFLVLVIGLFGLTLPEQARLERSINIQQTPQEIWPYVNNLHNFNQWSPWSRLDPDMVYNFSGPSEGVGARVEWRSERKNIGEGSQEIVLSKSNKYVQTALQFAKGVSASAEFFLEQDSGFTKVRWVFQTEFNGVLGRYFGLMIDKWVGSAYEEGLKNLKTLVEKS